MKKKNFFENITNEQAQAIASLSQVIATIHPQLQDEAIVAVMMKVKGINESKNLHSNDKFFADVIKHSKKILSKSALVRFIADNMIDYNIKKCNIIQKNVA